MEGIRDFNVAESEDGVINVELPYATAVAIGDSFEIKTDGTTWIKGTVQRIQRKRTGIVDKKIITCYGKTHILYEKHCLHADHHKYTNKDVGWIANDLIDHYFAGILTSNNVNVATGVDFTTFDCYGLSVGDALRRLASRGSCYFYIDNTDDTYFFVRGTVASGLTTEALGGLEIVDESGRKYIKIIIQGRHRDVQGSAGAGYPEYFKQDDRITTDTEATEVATALLAELNADRQQVMVLENSFLETRAGKTIILNVPADGFNNQVIEIQSIRWECKLLSRNKTWFTLGDTEPTIDTVLAQFMTKINWRPDVQIIRGQVFPPDPSDGEAFTLTIDVVVPGVYYGAIAGILYTWDEANSIWQRPPANIGRRAADPAAGGEIAGDEYYNTTDKNLYQWTGAAWASIASMALVDFSGDLDDIPDGVTYARALNAYITAGRPLSLLLSQIANGLFTADAAGRGKFGLGIVDGTLILGNVVAAQHMIAMTHAIGLPAFSWNGGLTRIEWGEFLISYKGTTYTIAAGNSQLKYLTWDFSVATNALQGSDDEPGQGANPALTDDDVFMCINYQDGSWDEPATQTIISGPSITTDWITARKFRTGSAVEWADDAGTAGVIWQVNGIKGKSNTGATQFFLDSTDGKVYAAGGDVIIDDYGITLAGERIRFKDTNYYGYIFANHANTRLTIQGAHDLLVDFHVAGKFIKLYGDVQMFGEWDWVPQSDGLGYIGRSDKRFRELNSILVKAYNNLRIPTYNGSDPASLVSGDLWLREDL